MDCIFCKIIKGEIPCSKVYEDDKVLCFLDIGPVKKGHTLVVPKKHSATLADDSAEDLAACMKAIKKIAPAIAQAAGADGFNVMNNSGAAAGQAVPHTHFHIIPRHSSDGLRHWLCYLEVALHAPTFR